MQFQRLRCMIQVRPEDRSCCMPAGRSTVNRAARRMTASCLFQRSCCVQSSTTWNMRIHCVGRPLLLCPCINELTSPDDSVGSPACTSLRPTPLTWSDSWLVITNPQDLAGVILTCSEKQLFRGADKSQPLLSEPTRHRIDQRLRVVCKLVAFPARRTMIGQQHVLDARDERPFGPRGTE